MNKGSIILDTFDSCNDIGIFESESSGEVWAYWLRIGRSMYTSKGGTVILSASCLGEWT